MTTEVNEKNPPPRSPNPSRSIVPTYIVGYAQHGETNTLIRRANDLLGVSYTFNMTATSLARDTPWEVLEEEVS